jgi:hypothetical protein
VTYTTTKVGVAFARAILAAASAAALTPALAATIQVPSDSPTIQRAIKRAHTGDTVVVDPGTYHERLDFLGKAITVTSRDGAATTIIDADGLGPVVRFRTGETRSAVLSGFTLQNGNALATTDFDGGGVSIYQSSPTVTGNTITRSAGCNGNGVAVEFSSALIKNNHILDNTEGCTGGTTGGGIYIGGSGSAEITDNIIENNPVDDTGAGIGMNAAGFPLIARNVIRNNTSNHDGGGIGLINDSRPTVINNVIYANKAAVGGGVSLSVPSGSTGGVWLNNTVADNIANEGSEVYAEGFPGVVKMTNNIFRTSQGTSSVMCDTGFGAQSPVFANNDFTSATGVIGDPSGACIDPLASGGNLSVDPQFVGGRGPKAYQLTAGSPLVDAGVRVKQVGKTDAARKPRTVDGNGDGTAVIDLGAYEYAPQ